MSKTITTAVAEELASVGTKVNARVVEHLVQVELEKRTAAIVKGLETLRGLQNDLKKIKPDVVTLNEDGTPASSTYTKDAFDKRKQLVEKIEKLEKALDLAIDSADMTKLYEVNGK